MAQESKSFDIEVDFYLCLTDPFYLLSKKPAATRGEPPNTKQPKVLSKSSLSSTISAKRASIGNLHFKNEKEKAKQVVGGWNLLNPLFIFFLS